MNLKRVLNVNGITIMCDLPVVTYQTVLANRSDIVLHEKGEKACLLIDIAILDDSNINTKETKKLSNYKNLENEFSRTWKGRTKIVPVIIAALGTFTKGLEKNLQLLSGDPLAVELQTNTLISTAHIIGTVLG
jgi:hypothetical protein